MEITFVNKTALVTGAGRGIGRAIAIALIEGGAKTFALSRTKEHLDSLKAEHPSVNTICVDLSDWNATRKAVEEIGPVDLLVNNAGIANPKSFLEYTEEEIDNMFDINTKAVFNVTQIIAKCMIDKGKGGAIVNISSQASQKAFFGASLYAATKGAMESLTKVLALELGPHQIRANCVNPTIVMTNMSREVWPEGAEKTKNMLKQIPQGKFAETKDVVHAVLYLLSDKADMINGAILPVDGGAWIT